MSIKHTSARFLAAAALLAAGPALAQEARTITYEDAIRIALEQNASVRLAANETALDAATVRQERMQFLPDLRLSTSGSTTYGQSGSALGVEQSQQSMNAGISSSLTLFDGFAGVASLRQARLGEQASQADLARARQTAVFTVANNYVALQARTEELRVRREDLTARQEEERQIQVRVDAGTRPVSDLYQQQAGVASARLAVVEAERALELAKVDLIQTLQLDPRGAYQFPAPAVGAARAEAYDLDALLTRAFQQRPDLAALQTRTEAAEQGVRVAKAGSLPTVTLSAGYNTALSSASELGVFDQLDDRRGGSVSLGVSIPLFDRDATRAATERARIQADNARISLETQRNEAGLQVRRAYLDHQSAVAQLEAAEAQLRAAELALSTSTERYRVGAATLLEVTQARATQVQAASAVVSARYNLVLQRTLIAYYVGDLDPERAAL